MCQHQPRCPEWPAPDHLAARIVADQPGQGWSLLCNGVIEFDDGGSQHSPPRSHPPNRISSLTGAVSPARHAHAPLPRPGLVLGAQSISAITAPRSRNSRSVLTIAVCMTGCPHRERVVPSAANPTGSPSQRAAQLGHGSFCIKVFTERAVVPLTRMLSHLLAECLTGSMALTLPRTHAPTKRAAGGWVSSPGRSASARPSASSRFRPG